MLRANPTRKRWTEMQVSHSDRLEDGRDFHSIGRIEASSEWRSVAAPIAEADRLTAVRHFRKGSGSFEPRTGRGFSRILAIS
jgi:hypothetical protein